MKIVERRSPKGRRVVLTKRGRSRPASCAGCGAILPAVPAKTALEMARIPKTKKRPQRPYGGKLCSTCSRENIRALARAPIAIKEEAKPKAKPKKAAKPKAKTAKKK